MNITVEVAGETNVGVKRTHNEDSYSIFEEEKLFIVCDGMGGHASGEIASQMAVETLRNFFKETREDPEQTWPYKMDRSKRYQENRLITGIKLLDFAQRGHCIIASRRRQVTQGEQSGRGLDTLGDGFQTLLLRVQAAPDNTDG